MKKIYEKPVVIIENFALCENIAVGCELKSNHQQDVCTYVDNGWITFTSQNTACVDVQIDQEEQEKSEKLCYHVPMEEYNIFTS